MILVTYQTEMVSQVKITSPVPIKIKLDDNERFKVKPFISSVVTTPLSLSLPLGEEMLSRQDILLLLLLLICLVVPNMAAVDVNQVR